MDHYEIRKGLHDRCTKWNSKTLRSLRKLCAHMPLVVKVRTFLQFPKTELIELSCFLNLKLYGVKSSILPIFAQ